MALRRVPLLALLFVGACSAELTTTDQPDAGAPDAGVDAGADAGMDGGQPRADAGMDAGHDAGPQDAGIPDSGPTIDAGELAYVIDGGELDSLDFGVVGDTRPPVYDDTPQYPTQVITTIYKDMAGLSPAIGFVVSTGDYMFASPFLGQASPQAQLYIGAAKNFPRANYATMGNHECDYSTSSANCSGQTNNPNYTAFLSDILGGLGLPTTNPYFVVFVSSSAAAATPWTAKFISSAANAWDEGQNTWLTQVLAVPTTYTFFARHEPTNGSGGAPGVAPSDTLLDAAALTLKLTSHAHSFSYDPTNKEVINGLGGAALDSGYTGTFGYVVCRQRADMAEQCSLFDYDTNAVSSEANSVFAINADGSAATVQ